MKIKIGLKSIIIILVLFIGFASIWPHLPVRAEDTFDARVDYVIDGDTVRVKRNGKTMTIRLFGIDAPEVGHGKGQSSQPYGERSKSYLAVKIQGKTVRVEILEKNGRRYIGVLTDQSGVVINRLMLKEGLAWWYHLYCKDKTWAADETEARIQRKGLWKDPNPMPPWAYRNCTGPGK